MTLPTLLLTLGIVAGSGSLALWWLLLQTVRSERRRLRNDNQARMEGQIRETGEDE